MIYLRWRGIVLFYIYGIDKAVIATVLGCSRRSVTRWHRQFHRTGNVTRKCPPTRGVHWSPEVLAYVKDYSVVHLCFYIEELKEAIHERYPNLGNISTSTVCRALRFNLKLTRKVLEKRARESSAAEIRAFHDRLAPFYGYPQQLVFVDETSKDGRDALRRYAWAPRGERAVVDLPFARGERVSVVAA